MSEAMTSESLELYVNSLPLSEVQMARVVAVIDDYLESKELQRLQAMGASVRKQRNFVINYAFRVKLDNTLKRKLFDYVSAAFGYLEEDPVAEAAVEIQELVNHSWNRIKGNKYIYPSLRSLERNPDGLADIIEGMESEGYLNPGVDTATLELTKIDLFG